MSIKNLARKILKWFGLFLLGAIVILAGIYIYLAMQTGEAAAEREIFKREESRFLVFAHRGGGGLHPENTLGAFEYSAGMGADVLELDVHATADGTLVIMHDATVDRTTDGGGKISEMTLDVVKKLDAGYRFSTDGGRTSPFRGRGISIPTLEEIFDALPAMTYNIEPKQKTPSIIKPLCALIRTHKMTEKVIVGSFRQGVIDEFRRECPEIATSGTPSEVAELLALSKTGLSESYSPPMQALQIPENLGKLSVVTKDFVENAHRKKLQVHVWTINETADMERLINLGVDGVMTDYPDRLLNLLNRKPNGGSRDR
ncbi:MAG: glycerophosphodiester phosphodiesterase [Pyrinomonadaceae bacterium]|nr:glycerophosphodiester phosphodiesterase [Pyrinomonadaceae bacterium]